MLKRGQAFQKKTSQKPFENTKEQVCHKCGSPDHFIKFCPLWALEQKKANFEKGKDIKKDKFVPSNRRMTIHEEDMNEKGLVRRKQQQWYLDSACSRHMTGDKSSFL